MVGMLGMVGMVEWANPTLTSFTAFLVVIGDHRIRFYINRFSLLWVDEP